MTGFYDIHSHFVYGVDDGAKTKEDMEAMLDAAWKDGVRKLIATPHITPGVQPFHEEIFYLRLSEAQKYCNQQNYDMLLYPGAEILYTPALDYYINDHRLMTLADTNLVLVEFLPELSYREIKAAVEMMIHNGYTPILAHVERYRFLRGRGIYRLKEETGVLYQVNGRSILKRNGFLSDLRIRKWLHDELIDYIASDSHNCDRRGTCMKAAYDRLKEEYGERYAEQLTGMI